MTSARRGRAAVKGPLVLRCGAGAGGARRRNASGGHCEITSATAPALLVLVVPFSVAAAGSPRR